MLMVPPEVPAIVAAMAAPLALNEAGQVYVAEAVGTVRSRVAPAAMLTLVPVASAVLVLNFRVPPLMVVAPLKVFA